jgi:hypothetical protein
MLGVVERLCRLNIETENFLKCSVRISDVRQKKQSKKDKLPTNIDIIAAIKETSRS